MSADMARHGRRSRYLAVVELRFGRYWPWRLFTVSSLEPVDTQRAGAIGTVPFLHHPSGEEGGPVAITGIRVEFVSPGGETMEEAA